MPINEPPHSCTDGPPEERHRHPRVFARNGRTDGFIPFDAVREWNPQHRCRDEEELSGPHKVSRLQPFIRPRPDDVIGELDEPCLAQFSGSTPIKCVSVRLCLEGTVDERRLIPVDRHSASERSSV